MKILHVITSLHTGGAEKLMAILLPQIRDLGHEVDLMLFDATPTHIMDEVRRAGIRIIAAGQGGSPYNPRNILRLRSVIGSYDIVHTHNTACQLFAPLANALTIGRRPRLVTTEHNATNRRRGNRIYKVADRLMYRAYDRIICIARQTYDNLTAYLPETTDKTEIVFNGIDTAAFTMPPRKRQDFDTFNITMVAAFRPQKNQDCAVRAIRRLPDYCRLILAGDGERRAEIEALARNLGVAHRVEFLGVCTDVPKLLARTDVSLLSSHWEGLSLSSLECMASGRPFVASDVDGLHEIVEGCGLLFADGDDIALADAIRSLDNDRNLYNAVAERCRNRASGYDISRTAADYDRIYRQLNIPHTK